MMVPSRLKSLFSLLFSLSALLAFFPCSQAARGLTSAEDMAAELKQLWDTLGLAAASGG